MLQVNVARLHDDNREPLSLAWVAGREGGTAVRREAAQAAALIGHLNLTHPNSIQVIGAYEAGIIGGFVERLLESHPAAVIVADDVVEVSRISGGALEGRCPDLLKDFIEVRGLGVLNIRTIFGETAVRRKMKLRLVAHLARPSPGARDPTERLPLSELTEEILGVTVRKVIIPVAAGRNLAVLVEAAVRNEILKLRGIDSMAEFLARQNQEMQKGEK
jgi:serine kinase of HPr protein (carbohydrate metabolism regulator)